MIIRAAKSIKERVFNNAHNIAITVYSILPKFLLYSKINVYQ